MTGGHLGSLSVEQLPIDQEHDHLRVEFGEFVSERVKFLDCHRLLEDVGLPLEADRMGVLEWIIWIFC